MLCKVSVLKQLSAPADFQYEPPADDPVVKLRVAMGRLDCEWIGIFI